MQKSFTGKRTWVLLVLILLIFILLSYILVSKQPEEYPSYVSESPSPTGIKALYTYIEDEVGSVDRWSHNPTLLSTDGDQQLLFMVEPFFVPEQEVMESYISFLEAGNTIILLKTNPDGMFGLKTNPVMSEMEDAVQVENPKGEKYDAIIPSSVRIRSNEGDEILLTDEAGVIALKRSFGEGILIVSTTPNWVTNDQILDEDHTELAFSLIDESGEWNSILIDEYVHGAGHSPTVTTLYPKWLLVFTVQSILVMILLLWYQGKRFGPIITPREESVRFSNERVKALAAWYKRGKLYGESLAIQADYIKLLLQERWGISYRKDWTDIAEQLKRRGNHMTDDEVQSFVTGLTNILRKRTINKQEYVLWSKKIDRLRKEVEEG